MRYQILDDALIEHIDQSDPIDQADWLILTESKEFPGHWLVDGLDPEFLFDFEDMLGRYRLISPTRIDEFLQEVENKKYHVVFAEDPVNLLDAYKALKQEPPLDLNSSLENTVRGFLPWQVVGFNKLIRSDLPAGLAIWDTGAGKTALMAAAIRWHMMQNQIDLALVMVKAHNKVDTQAKLLSLGDIASIVVDGTSIKRFKTYEEIEQRLESKQPTVVIANYEKLRDDSGVFDGFLNQRRVFFCWDEIPTKLGNRSTQIYEATKKTLYKSFVSKPRPSWMRHLVLTATPIEQDPDGLFSYLNLVRPRFLGTVAEFHAAHVIKRNFYSKAPELWGDLDKIEAQIEHMTHRVSKADPDVASMFPSVIPNRQIVDWNPKHRSVYERFTKAAEDILEEEDSGINMLSMIQVMQMLCDAPSMIKMSAANREGFLKELSTSEGKDLGLTPSGSEAALRLLSMVPISSLTDDGHTKLDAWREIILEKHPTSKIVTHSTWASYIFPVWHHWLDRWGVSYVTYSGTDKQKQIALDTFRTDPSIRVFLSGDAGADSIDIPQAEVGVSYNGAWKWTTMKQREGRRDRVNSTFDTIYTYDLAMANSVEDRKQEIRDRKQSYHDAIFEGRAVESALSAKLTADDLRYMLLGYRLDNED